MSVQPLTKIVPRWEWRTFGERFGGADDRITALEPVRVEDSDEIYLLSLAGNASVKLRDELVDVKLLQEENADGLEQWRPVLKAPFPLDREAVGTLLSAVGIDDPPALERDTYTPQQLVRDVLRHDPRLLAVPVRKHRAHYRVGGCRAEVTSFHTSAGAIRTIAVEDEDPELVTRTVRELGLSGRPNVCPARGLKALVGFGPTRCAVIDIGTNSVKLHVGERREGAWATVTDRAEITRLGEGLDRTGRLDPAAIERTAAAIDAMVDEARGLDAVAIAAVGTAGLRLAPNAHALVDAVLARTGVIVETLSGDEEARLSYVGATASLAIGDGALVVLETGGGSTQLTFGTGRTVDDRFSLDLGAVRVTERFALDRAVSSDALRAVLAAIDDELDALDGHPAGAAVIALGGAVTNMAAVQHGLTTYDPEIVHGTVLDVAEIDRQLELYRTRDADGRRAIAGLQPKRADIILAGACIVRAVLARLDAPALTVSDRGLRHGLLIARFRSAEPAIRGLPARA